MRKFIDSIESSDTVMSTLSGPNGAGPVAYGQDFGTLAPDGRLQAVTGFLEPAA